MLAVTDKIVALLVALSPESIEALPPAERRRLAAHCRHVAAIAEPPEATEPAQQRAGVLADLERRQQHE